MTVPIFKFLRRSLDVSKAWNITCGNPSRKFVHLPPNGKLGKIIIDSKVPDWDGILFVPRRVCFPFACQAKAVQPMTDRGLVQVGC